MSEEDTDTIKKCTCTNVCSPKYEKFGMFNKFFLSMAYMYVLNYCSWQYLNGTDQITEHFLHLHFSSCPKKKYMCVYCHMAKKSRVGRSALIFFGFFFCLFITIGKTGNSRSGIRFRYFIFEISGKPSFVLWRVTQFVYLLCSQFRQKASGWIKKHCCWLNNKNGYPNSV